MAKKPNYSTVSTAAVDPGAIPPPPKRKGGRLSKSWLIGAAGLLVIIALVWGLAAACGSGSADDEGSAGGSEQRAIGSAHGPESISDGIPSRYTRDKAGAGTAAVNFITAVSQAMEGRIDAEKLKESRVGTTPSESLSKVLDSASDRRDDGSVFNAAPVMVTVPQYSADEATVSVWSVGASQSPVNDSGKKGVLTVWSTTTVTLRWIDDDWKAVDWSFQSGPNPDEVTLPEADSTLSQTALSGSYSFFIN